MKLKNVVLRNNWYWASSEILFYSRLIEIRLNLLVFFSFFFHFIHIDFQESYLVYYGTCFFKILKISMITLTPLFSICLLVSQFLNFGLAVSLNTTFSFWWNNYFDAFNLSRWLAISLVNNVVSWVFLHVCLF